MGAGAREAATLWSADGRTWPKKPVPLPTSAPGSARPAASDALTLMVGDHGKPFVGFLFLRIVLLIGALASVTMMVETEGKPLEAIVAELSA